jgi:small subunit ribosomal protein S16
MAIKIRHTRSCSKKHPFYRVVATNSGTRRDGRPLEILGYYNPMTNPVEVKLEREKIQKWLSLGAEASDTVRSLLKKSAYYAVTLKNIDRAAYSGSTA